MRRRPGADRGRGVDQGRLDQSIQSFETAIRLRPDSKGRLTPVACDFKCGFDRDDPRCLGNVAVARGYAIVYPNGLGSRPLRGVRTWNAGGNRNDEYYWLRDDTRQDKDVLAYLAAENAYKEAMLAHVQPLENRLYDEIVARIKQDDSSVPYRKRGYWYYSRFDAGKEYPVYARKAGSLDAAEQTAGNVGSVAYHFKRMGIFRLAAGGIDADELVAIDAQKAAIDRNTQQFVRGLPANNVLLTGSRGTGKSSLVRALLNTYKTETRSVPSRK